MNVWITNFNNLDRGFRRLVEWLQDANVSIKVIDNGSTWEPLLRYYETSGLEIIRPGNNLGPYAFWELGLHRSSERFIITDPDVVPSSECPKDLIARMSEMLDKGHKKVGPSLRIDNLPGNYPGTEKVISWEQQFWTNPTEGGYAALIDTTFAMYEPDRPFELPALRLAAPYSFEHVPWYEGSEQNAERDFYNSTKRMEWTNW